METEHLKWKKKTIKVMDTQHEPLLRTILS